MRNRNLALITIMFFSMVMLAKDKQREWKTGQLTDISTERGSRLVSTGQGTFVHKRSDYVYYQIETPDMTYIAARHLTSKHDKQLHVTVNDSIRFAIESDNFYVLDEENKEHKLSLEQKRRNKEQK